MIQPAIQIVTSSNVLSLVFFHSLMRPYIVYGRFINSTSYICMISLHSPPPPLTHCLLLLRRKLLRLSTRVHLPIWICSVRGRRYVTLAKWVNEVGHCPPSSLGNFSVIEQMHFCGPNCIARLQCELRLRQLHLNKKPKTTNNLNWHICSYSSHFVVRTLGLWVVKKFVVTFALTDTDALQVCFAI